MMDELPPGWATTSVGEIIDARNGRAFKSTEWRQQGTPIIRIQNLKASDATFNYFDGLLEEKHVVKAGDLLFAWSGTPGTSFGAHVWNGKDAALNQHIFRLDFDRTAFNTNYLCYALNQNVARYIEQAQGGVGLAHITKAKFDASLLPIAPINEQNRIVDRLDELFSRIDEGERALVRVQKLVECYRQSVLKAAVTGELTRGWREKNLGLAESGEAWLARILKARREAWEKAELDKMKAKGITPANDKWKQKYEEPAAPDTTGLPELPQGWCWLSMQQLSWASSYGTSEKCGYGTNGPAVLRIPNIRSGRFTFEDIKHSVAQLDIDDDELLSAGDLLVVRTNGSDRIIGVGAVALADPPMRCYFASYLIRFRLVPDAQLSEWVNYCWQSSVVREFVGHRKASSAGQYNISQSSLMELCLPIPPVAERGVIADEIARIISKAENAAESMRRQAGHATALRQAVLKTAFSGGLGPQDAGDEPASELLHRIAAERSQAPAKPRRGITRKSGKA